MVNPAADQYFQDNFYFISILDAGKSDLKANFAVLYISQCNNAVYMNILRLFKTTPKSYSIHSSY